MSAPVNIFKKRLQGGDPLIGLWSSMASPVAAEATSLVGYDWMLFDTEHSPVEVAALQPLLQAAAVGSAAHIARPAWNDKVLIKKMLDIGVQTLLIPFVQNAQEAAQAVAASRYPPEGIRGVAGATRASRYGPTAEYVQTANDQISILVQIETMQALDQLESIAAVDGVDGIFIGPADLSASMGHLGNSSAPEVQAAIQDAAKRILAAGKAPGILAMTPADAKRYLSWGFQFVACGVDTGLLVGAAKSQLADIRG